MYYLKPMCFICLNSQSTLRIVNKEMLRNLLFCIDTTEDFISPISNRMKLCKQCLDKLNAALHFKKMCLFNIIQFKDYIDQLERVSKNCDTFNALKVELTDFKHQKTKDVNLNFEQREEEEFKCKFVKEEIVDEINSEYQEEYSSEEIQPLVNKEEILEDTREIQSKIVLEQMYRYQEFKKNEKSFEKELLFSCLICQEYFESKRNLTQHMLLHTNGRLKYFVKNKPYFMNKEQDSSLISKKDNKLAQPFSKVYSSRRLQTCSICGKCFGWDSSLMRHVMTSHANDERFCCSICKKCCYGSYELKKHIMLIHNKERPYCCPTCGKSFGMSSDLNRHTLTHTNERPHSCLICNKNFALKGTLKRHMLIHDKPPKL